MTIEQHYRWVRDYHQPNAVWRFFHQRTLLMDLMESCLNILKVRG